MGNEKPIIGVIASWGKSGPPEREIVIGKLFPRINLFTWSSKSDYVTLKAALEQFESMFSAAVVKLNKLTIAHAVETKLLVLNADGAVCYLDGKPRAALLAEYQSRVLSAKKESSKTGKPVSTPSRDAILGKKNSDIEGAIKSTSRLLALAEKIGERPRLPNMDAPVRVLLAEDEDTSYIKTSVQVVDHVLRVGTDMLNKMADPNIVTRVLCAIYDVNRESLGKILKDPLSSMPVVFKANLAKEQSRESRESRVIRGQPEDGKPSGGEGPTDQSVGSAADAAAK